MLNDMETFGLESSWCTLTPALTGINPRLYVESSIPSEKGFHFYLYLEQLFNADGADYFEAFIANCTEKYKFTSVSHTDFRFALERYVIDHMYEPDIILEKIDWNAWLTGSGEAPVKPDFSCYGIQTVYNLAESFI